MRLAKSSVRVELGKVPAIGNVETGTIIGLTISGAALCDAMAEHDVPEVDVPADCFELVAYMKRHGFIEDETGEGAAFPNRVRLHSAYLHDDDLIHLAEVMQAAGTTAGIDNVFPDGARATLRACACCGAGRVGVSIAADGAAYACHMLHYSQFCLGNAFEDSADVLRDALFRFALPTVDDIFGCKDCGKRYLCGGGCRARAYLEYGRADCRDPYCAYNREAIHQRIKTLITMTN